MWTKLSIDGSRYKHERLLRKEIRENGKKEKNDLVEICYLRYGLSYEKFPFFLSLLPPPFFTRFLGTEGGAANWEPPIRVACAKWQKMKKEEKGNFFGFYGLNIIKIKKKM